MSAGWLRVRLQYEFKATTYNNSDDFEEAEPVLELFVTLSVKLILYKLVSYKQKRAAYLAVCAHSGDVDDD